MQGLREITVDIICNHIKFKEKKIRLNVMVIAQMIVKIFNIFIIICSIY